MRLWRSLFLFPALLVLLAATCPQARAADDKKAAGGQFEVAVTRDITYFEGKDADSEKHKLDLFMPKGQKNVPVLFFIHGGSWSNGDRKLYGTLGQVFARNGVGTVIISYRLSPKVQHPAHIEDVARAFAWTVKNIGTYGGNTNEIFVSGHSAGAHLAALLATNDRYLKAEKVDRSSIKGVIALSGIYQISPTTMPSVFTEDAGLTRDASPLLHISDKLPPFLIGYAAKDLDDFDIYAEDFAKALKAKKVEATTFKVNNRSHISIMFCAALSETDPCSAAMLEFIGSHTGRQLVKKDAK